MAEIKYTEAGQESRKKQLAALRERVKRVRRLDQLKAAPEWRDFLALLNSFIEMEQRRREVLVVDCARFDESADVVRGKIAVTLERQAAFELVRDLVERSPEQEEHLNARIRELEETFAEAKTALS